MKELLDVLGEEYVEAIRSEAMGDLVGTFEVARRLEETAKAMQKHAAELMTNEQRAALAARCLSGEV